MTASRKIISPLRRSKLRGFRITMPSEQSTEQWPEVVVRALKANEVSLVAYVPDNVLAPLIKLIHADPYFTVVVPAREEEAVGIVTGAYMGGRKAPAVQVGEVAPARDRCPGPGGAADWKQHECRCPISGAKFVGQEGHFQRHHASMPKSHTYAGDQQQKVAAGKDGSCKKQGEQKSGGDDKFCAIATISNNSERNRRKYGNYSIYKRNDECRPGVGQIELIFDRVGDNGHKCHLAYSACF